MSLVVHMRSLKLIYLTRTYGVEDRLEKGATSAWIVTVLIVPDKSIKTKSRRKREVGDQQHLLHACSWTFGYSMMFLSAQWSLIEANGDGYVSRSALDMSAVWIWSWFEFCDLRWCQSKGVLAVKSDWNHSQIWPNMSCCGSLFGKFWCLGDLSELQLVLRWAATTAGERSQAYFGAWGRGSECNIGQLSPY